MYMTIQRRISSLYPNAKYSFDTDVYITIWRYNYPRDVFIKLWEDLEKFIKEGVILSSSTVLIELSRQRDEIHEFFRQIPDLFVDPVEEEQNYVRYLINHEDFNKQGLSSSEKHLADPYVVALAKVHKLNVVTFETHHQTNSIPHACDILDIRCMKFLDFIREENLKY